MASNRYQVVGLFAGIPLFSGAWLAALFNNAWLGVIGLIIMLVGLFLANKVEVRSDVTTHLFRGAVAGALAGLVARMLGVVASLVLGVTQSTQFSDMSDVFRVTLAGDWGASLVLILLTAGLGASVCLLVPEAKDARSGKEG